MIVIKCGAKATTKQAKDLILNFKNKLYGTNY